jgi:hypothetical protein
LIGLVVLGLAASCQQHCQARRRQQYVSHRILSRSSLSQYNISLMGYCVKASVFGDET